jgi:hypothetical protein
MNTQHIGRSGELLVQFRLLALGIDSAPMTTDAGIDLVAYAPRAQRAVTIQVKTNRRAKPGGGKGKLALDWWISADCPAELVAFVDLSTETAWLFRSAEVAELAQQHSGGRHHLYMYTDPRAVPAKGRKSMLADFDGYLLEQRVGELLAGTAATGA